MDVEKSGRPNQKRRTRKDLLLAATRLMKQGRKPSLEEVAEAALVSRATAYRYFQNVEALLVEASLDVETPEAEILFRDDDSTDPIARLERVDAALHDMVVGNEAQWRLMLAHSLQRSAAGTVSQEIPTRQNRRSPLIEAALLPARAEFKPAQLKTLSKALAIVIGSEAMLVCKDVLQLDDAETRKIKRWAIRALVDAARNAP